MHTELVGKYVIPHDSRDSTSTTSRRCRVVAVYVGPTTPRHVEPPPDVPSDSERSFLMPLDVTDEPRLVIANALGDMRDVGLDAVRLCWD